MGLNIGLYLRRSEGPIRKFQSIGTEVRSDRCGLPTRKEQRASAYVSRKRMWRTLLELSSHPPVLHQNRSRSFRNQCWTCWYIKETPRNPPSVLWAVFDFFLSCNWSPIISSLSFYPLFENCQYLVRIVEWRALWGSSGLCIISYLGLVSMLH